jgi:hypothetical protein
MSSSDGRRAGLLNAYVGDQSLLYSFAIRVFGFAVKVSRRPIVFALAAGKNVLTPGSRKDLADAAPPFGQNADGWLWLSLP